MLVCLVILNRAYDGKYFASYLRTKTAGKMPRTAGEIWDISLQGRAVGGGGCIVTIIGVV